jgi:shikimate kinase
MTKPKLSLIGMPSAGKSTIAKEVSNILNFSLIDLDHMVEQKEGESLINILLKKGSKYFLDMQYAFLLELKPEDNAVISTAGSIIYHEPAIKWLKENTVICFLDTELSVIEERLSISPKAVVGLKEKGLQKLWDERIPVYKQLMDISVTTKNKDISEIAREIISKFS